MSSQRRGWVELICGPMFSGKTEELIRRVRRALIARQKVQVFKPKMDTRYDGSAVASHDGTKVIACPVSSAREILDLVKLEPETRVVAIDEAQFLPGIAAVCDELANQGIRVIVATLDANFRREPFGESPQLLALARTVDKLVAVCVRCGDEAAEFTQRLVSGRPAPYDAAEILVGGGDSYEARCRRCHEVPRKPERREDEKAELG